MDVGSHLPYEALLLLGGDCGFVSSNLALSVPILISTFFHQDPSAVDEPTVKIFMSECLDLVY